MKICFISHSFLPTIGGAELVVHHLASHLTGMGHEIFVLTHSKKNKVNLNLNYTILYYPRPPKEILLGPIFAAYLLGYNKKYQFDIIHIHVAVLGYHAIKIKKMLKAPIVITTHGGDIQRYPEINYGLRLDPVLNRRIEYALRKADLVTAIGSSTHNDYLEIGIAVDRIVDIANGVDLERFNDDSFNIRSKLGLPRDAKLLLSVGRYHPKKGYEYLIRAMPEIIEQNSQVRCLLVGKRLYLLKPLINELSLEKIVILMEEQGVKENGLSVKNNVDRMPNDLLLAAYKSSDIYVSSSLIEGFALTVIEAMAAGLPLVATNVPGNEDAVLNGVNGFLAPSKNPHLLAQQTNRLLADDGLRLKMGSMSKKMVRQYEWSSIAEQYVKQYQKITYRLNKID